MPIFTECDMSHSADFIQANVHRDQRSSSINLGPSLRKSCFGNVLQKFRKFFQRRTQTNESSRLSVQAVDSGKEF